MSQRVHLVTDGGPGELSVTEMVRRMAVALPDAVIDVTAVSPGDTVAAGTCVAELVRRRGDADRLIVHDVTPRHGEPIRGERYCIGRSRNGALVVGANVGFAWSFVIDELIWLCSMDLPVRTREHLARDRLPTAVAHACAHHPHAATTAVPRWEIPSPPDSRPPWTLRSGVPGSVRDEPRRDRGEVSEEA